MNSTLAIEAEGLMKEFGETRAVDGIDLTVPGGSVYGVVGPNGAGKTTTIRMLSTLLRPDAGTAQVYGYDVVREAAIVRGLVSLTGQFASVDDGLTGHQNLVLLARLLGYSRTAARKRASDLLDPRSRHQVWDTVRAAVSRGTTVLLTTQYLDKADELADRIAVIDHGEVIAEGTRAS